MGRLRDCWGRIAVRVRLRKQDGREAGGDRVRDGRVSAKPVRGGRGQSVRAVDTDRAASVVAAGDPLELVARRSGVLATQRANLVLVGACGVLSGGVGVLGLVSYQVAASCEPIPIMVRVGQKADQLMHFEPMETRGDLRDVLTEKLLGRYVEARETIDLQSESLRWEDVYALSTEQISRNFVAVMEKRNPNSPYQLYAKQNRTRSININSMNKLGNSTTYRVEFSTVDRDKFNQVLEKRDWVVTTTVSYEPTAASYSNRFMNPYGMRVTAYVISELNKG